MATNPPHLVVDPLGLRFKYSPFRYLERTLRDRTLPFNTLAGFNDMYEDDYQLEHFFNNRADADALLRPVDNAITLTRRAIDAELSGYRVTAFSGQPNISLMWSHYAERHTGVCYCFRAERHSRWDEIRPIFPNVEMQSGAVNYSSQLPLVTVFQQATSERMLGTLASTVVLTKPIEWAYENEFRYWTSENQSSFTFDPVTLHAVILGRRVGHGEVNSARVLVESYNAANSTNVAVWFAHRRAPSFNLGICADQNFRDNSESKIHDLIPELPAGSDNPLTPNPTVP